TPWTSRPGRTSPPSATSSSRSSTRAPRCAPSPRTCAPTRCSTASPRGSEAQGGTGSRPPPPAAPSPPPAGPSMKRSRMMTSEHAASGQAGGVPGLSWSGTVDYGPGPLHAPPTLVELRALVARSPRLRALGTRHSFSEVAASDAPLVTLARMPADLEFDTTARTVRVAAGVRYGELALAAAERGLALPSMGSLPHIS